MPKEKTIRNEVNEKRMKICATHERIKTTIVAKSMTNF